MLNCTLIYRKFNQKVAKERSIKRKTHKLMNIKKGFKDLTQVKQ